MNLGDFKMKLNTLLVVPALLSALLLSACGEKTTEATDAAATTDATAPATPAVEVAPAVEIAPAPPAASDTAGGGGYEPTAEERIPGETRPVTAPVEAAPAAAAPVEAAPVEAAPAN